MSFYGVPVCRSCSSSPRPGYAWLGRSQPGELSLSRGRGWITQEEDRERAFVRVGRTRIGGMRGYAEGRQRDSRATLFEMLGTSRCVCPVASHRHIPTKKRPDSLMVLPIVLLFDKPTTSLKCENKTPTLKNKTRSFVSNLGTSTSNVRGGANSTPRGKDIRNSRTGCCFE